LPPINEQQMVVLNADDEPWEGLVEAEPSLDFDAWGRRWLSDLCGQPVPFQRVQAVGHLMTHRILFPLRWLRTRNGCCEHFLCAGSCIVPHRVDEQIIRSESLIISNKLQPTIIQGNFDCWVPALRSHPDILEEKRTSKTTF
jgi:hypothetical protein